MTTKCKFIEQLRYGYASAEISVEQSNISIRFQQELNIACGLEAIRFLLLPLSGFEGLSRSYTVNLYTPSMVYMPCLVTMENGIVKIEQAAAIGTIHQAS